MGLETTQFPHHICHTKGRLSSIHMTQYSHIHASDSSERRQIRQYVQDGTMEKGSENLNPEIGLVLI